jgi:hypothetical protein
MIKLNRPAELVIIKKFIDEAIKPEEDRIMEAQMNGDFDYEPINSEKVNKEIYSNLINEYEYKNIQELNKEYKNVKNNKLDPLYGEYLGFLQRLQVRKRLLEKYVKTLDKSRIKTPEEYYQEIEDAPIYNVMGTFGFAAPETHATLSERESQYNFDENAYDNLLKNKLTTTMVNTGPQKKCDLEEKNLSLDDLISITYAKYTYNQPKLDNCRDFILQRLSRGEKIQNPETERFLQGIDPALYDTYKNKTEIKKKFYTEKYKKLMSDENHGGNHVKTRRKNKNKKIKKSRKLKKSRKIRKK